ncbi:MAG: hypothetical protein Q9210_007164, partial [Variospora velana]
YKDFEKTHNRSYDWGMAAYNRRSINKKKNPLCRKDHAWNLRKSPRESLRQNPPKRERKPVKPKPLLLLEEEDDTLDIKIIGPAPIMQDRRTSEYFSCSMKLVNDFLV